MDLLNPLNRNCKYSKFVLVIWQIWSKKISSVENFDKSEHFADKNSYTYDSIFRFPGEFPQDNVRIACYDWSESLPYRDHLNVSIVLSEYPFSTFRYPRNSFVVIRKLFFIFIMNSDTYFNLKSA